MRHIAQVEMVGEAATDALGRRLGRVLERGDLVGLDGELGAGKTTLVRGIAAGMGADPAEVRSPTFVLHHVHPGRLALHHIDAFRLGPGALVVDELDLAELLAEGVVALEWAAYAAHLERFAPIRIELCSPEPDRRVARLGEDAPERVRRVFAATDERS